MVFTRNNRNISDADIPKLVQAIAETKDVEEIQLPFNNITSSGAKELIRLLRAEGVLERIRLLNLAHNCLDDGCLQDLAQSNIKVLDLRSNLISDHGVDILIKNQQQESINVSGLWVQKDMLVELAKKVRPALVKDQAQESSNSRLSKYKEAFEPPSGQVPQAPVKKSSSAKLLSLLSGRFRKKKSEIVSRDPVPVLASAQAPGHESSSGIPKLVHFIWVGSRPMPSCRIAVIEKWMQSLNLNIS